MRRQVMWNVCALLSSMVGCLACSRPADLVPAAIAERPRAMTNAVMAQQNGVQVTAQSRLWPGIADEVTALRVVVQNQSGQDVSVRYGDFELVAQDGTRYHAIPPLRIGDSSDIAQHRAIVPDFDFAAFELAPYYGNVYPGLAVYGGAFDYDSNYYSEYYTHWRGEALPDEKMLAKAIPEGVVRSGGHVDGFLYFQKVESDKRSTTLVADLQSAESGRQVARLQLPFIVR
jgi:hypothetical protein